MSDSSTSLQYRIGCFFDSFKNILPSFRLKAKGSCNCRIPFPFKISVFVSFLRTYSQTHSRTPQSAAFRHSRLFPSSRQRINAAVLTGNGNTGQQYCRDMPSCCLSSSCLSPLTLPDPSCEFFKIGGYNFARQKGTAALKATAPMHFINALLTGYDIRIRALTGSVSFSPISSRGSPGDPGRTRGCTACARLLVQVCTAVAKAGKEL